MNSIKKIAAILLSLTLPSLYFCSKNKEQVKQEHIQLELGYGLVGFMERNKFGIKNLFGDTIRIAKYDTIESFKDGIARIREVDKWGLIDTLGKIIIPTGYDAISLPKDGFAIVGKKNQSNEWKFAIIKVNGEMFTDFIYDKPRFFSEGLLAHYILIDDEEVKDLFYRAYGRKGLDLYYGNHTMWGYINKRGHIVIPYQFEELKMWSAGNDLNVMFAVKEKRLNEYLDRITVTSNFYEYPAGDFINGKALVNKKKWGIINKNGKILIDFKFDDFKDFKEGLAGVKVKNNWGFIDTLGRIIINPIYEEVKNFHEGIAAVKFKGKWGYVDNKGKFITPFKYDDAFDFVDSLGMAFFGDETLFVNRKGEENYLKKSSSF